ncbi:hypothetical protein GOBAR_DD15002 [Gossypium barbadense]|nr:hypothetical protein GOBAR_DD15002 [Gossypium barbadense]
MDNQFFAAIHFDGVILKTTVGCKFETCQKIGMRFNKNVSIDNMKEKINAKIARCCGRKMSKLFYKFPVLSNPVKFAEIKLLDDENVKTMVASYCPTGRLVDVEHVEDVTSLSQQYGAEDPCTEVLRAFFIGESIHPVVIETHTNGEDESNNNVCSDHEGEDFSDLDVDEVSNNIDDELHAYEFPKYPETILVHQLLADIESKELFKGQQFATKDDCIFSIKWDYGVVE